MGNGRVCQQSQTHGNGDTVVAAQSRALGKHKLAVVGHIQSLGGHVNGAVRILLADHVQMALQNHGGVVFQAAGAGAIDNHIVHFILNVPKAMGLGKVHHIIRHGLCIPGAMGNGTDFLKITENGPGLQTRQFLRFHNSRSFSFTSQLYPITGL